MSLILFNEEIMVAKNESFFGTIIFVFIHYRIALATTRLTRSAGIGTVPQNFKNQMFFLSKRNPIFQKITKTNRNHKN